MTDIPKDPNQFKRWADAECVRWPEALTIEAAHAADAWKYQGSNLKIVEFAVSYETWRAMETPRAETIAAMKEVEAGGGTIFDGTTEEAFAEIRHRQPPRS